MNIVLINGSPRGENSNSFKMASSFVKGIKDGSNNVNITTFHLSEKNFINCEGCLNCWRREKVECIHDDDMTEMLDVFVESDLVLWVTPLYHYTVTSLLKKFLERTLPVNSPLQMYTDGVYHHPCLYEKVETQKHILISGSGFPENDNFNIIEEYMQEICRGNLVEVIFSGMTELYQYSEWDRIVDKYQEVIVQAGKEFIQNGKISNETKKRLKEPLMENDTFVDITNLNWKAEGNMDHLKFDLQASEDNKAAYETGLDGEGYKYLHEMLGAFNNNNKLGLDVKIEYQFNDTKESAFFIVKDDFIQLKPGSVSDPNLKIITTYKNWLKISSGEIDGPDGLMKGLYKIEGDLNLMMKMDNLFSKEDNEVKKVKKVKEKTGKSFYGVKGETWMLISLIPWLISWATFPINSSLSTIVPLILSVGTLLLKKRVNAVTYFEKMNGFYFFALSILGLYNSSLLQNYGVEVNFLFMAVIWGISLFGKNSLTAEYSVYSQEGDLSNNIIFLKTNGFITLFWTCLYLLQWGGKLLLNSYGIGTLYPLLFLLLPFGFMFNSFFQRWYPEKIIKK